MSADWDPANIAGDDAVDLTVLLASEFERLEADVLEHLKGSWCSEQKARLLLELVVLARPEVCVEIGAFSGSTTLPILAGLRHVGRGRAYVVEAWSNEEATRGLPGHDVNAKWWATVDMAAVRAQFDALIEGWSLGPWCDVLAEPSSQVAARVPPIDLLHLDGSFAEEGASQDSDNYLPKVVPGGHVVLSNALVTVGGRPAKMRALWPLFDQCDILDEVDGGNTLLFRKR